MPPLDSAALLEVWEQGASQSPVERALKLLAVAWPEKAAADWGRVSIGERDSSLLDLQEEWFGAELEGSAVCPQCSERLQVTFRTTDIRTSSPAFPPGENLRVAASGYELACRLPNSFDLLAVARIPGTAGNEALLKRCIEEARFQGASVAADTVSLPEEVVQAASTAMQRTDQQANVEIALVCAACAHAWSQPFDIVSYLWSEIEDWAQRLVLEIHVLASAYGWSEKEIVALTANRRRMYWDLVGA